MALKVFPFLLLSLALQGAEVRAENVRVVIRLQERVPLENLIAAVSNPRSPRYRKYYSPEEIRSLVGPSDEDYQALLAQLKQKQMTIVSESKTRLFLIAEGPAPALEEGFKKGSGLIASIRATAKHRKMSPRYRLFAKKSPLTILSPAQIKKAYAFDALYEGGLSGESQHLAIASYDGYHPEDLEAYYRESGLPTPKIDQVFFNGQTPVNESSAVETELDVELAGMVAPGAQIHVFASSTNDDPGEVQLFSAILDDNRSKVVSYSWGSCETNFPVEHIADMDRLYARAVAQGITIVVASGDAGSDGCRNGGKTASWPGSQPHVLSVGGTSLNLAADQEPVETGWQGSGGGISSRYPLPDYQLRFQAPYSKRSFPDVAFNADPNTAQAIWTHRGSDAGHWTATGGTSVAAPQWAGLLLLLGEARAKLGKKGLGFINPILYSMSEDTRSKVFRDITEGNNGYPAQAGWDAVTGLGSPNASPFVGFLLGQ